MKDISKGRTLTYNKANKNYTIIVPKEIIKLYELNKGLNIYFEIDIKEKSLRLLWDEQKKE